MHPPIDSETNSGSVRGGNSNGDSYRWSFDGTRQAETAPADLHLPALRSEAFTVSAKVVWRDMEGVTHERAIAVDAVATLVIEQITHSGGVETLIHIEWEMS